MEWRRLAKTGAIRAVIASGALRGLQASKGGAGSYSMASWICSGTLPHDVGGNGKAGIKDPSRHAASP